MEELLGMSGWICLNGCIIPLLLMVLFVYLVFYLVNLPLDDCGGQAYNEAGSVL